MKLLILAFAILFHLNLLSCQFDYGYHNYAQFTAVLQQYANKFPSKAYLYSIGKSVKGMCASF